jgi:hypothetical protein
MQFDKEQILQLLRSRGQHDQADQAQQNLPDQVDTEQHGGLLAQHGVDVADLIQMFGGGLRNKL